MLVDNRVKLALCEANVLAIGPHPTALSLYGEGLRFMSDHTGGSRAGRVGSLKGL